jgi:hypothetical protein
MGGNPTDRWTRFRLERVSRETIAREGSSRSAPRPCGPAPLRHRERTRLRRLVRGRASDAVLAYARASCEPIHAVAVPSRGTVPATPSSLPFRSGRPSRPPRARNRSYDVANHEPLTLSPGGPGGGEGSCIWRRSNRERLAGRRRKKFSLSPGEAGGPFDSAAAPPPLAQGARTVGVSGAATAARVSRPSPAPPLSRAPPSGPPPPSARRAASASPPRAAGRPPPARPTRSPSGSSR